MKELLTGVDSKYLEAVDNFIKHRKEIKSAFTERGLNLFLNKINALDAQGQNINALIELAIESGWKTIYPEKKGFTQQVKPPTVLGQNLDASAMLGKKEIMALRENTKRSRTAGLTKIKDILNGRSQRA